MTRTTAALLAASLLLPGFAPNAASAQAMPDAATLLGLSNVERREKPRAAYGHDLIGSLPGGARVEVELEADGRIEEVEARGALFPIAEIAPLVPEVVRANAQWPANATLEKIEFDRDGRIEIDGRLADGREFDAEFAADGHLLEFDIDD